MRIQNYIVRFAIVAVCILTAGCSLFPENFFRQEERLPGQRVPIQLVSDASQQRVGGPDVQLFQPVNAQVWNQPGGNEQHTPRHIASARQIAQRWAVTIGEGSRGNKSQTAQPIIVQNIVFAMDAGSRVSALSLSSGAVIWQKELATTRERSGFFGGGLGYDTTSGVLVVATGFRELVGLRARTGEEIWRKVLTAAARGGPTLSNGRAYVVTTDNKLTALQAANGKGLWRHEGNPEQTSILGTASPALAGNSVFGAFSNGDVYALNASDGSVIWEDSLAALGGSLLSEIPDVNALPVVDDELVYFTSNGSRTAAYNHARGVQIWEAPVGGPETPILGGTHLFVLTGDNVVQALDRRSGNRRWAIQLQSSQRRALRQPLIVSWFGPLLVGNRLIVASSQGEIRSLNPFTGKSLGTDRLPGGAVMAPVAANGYVLFVTDNGRLVAFR